jgi:hypothetical protein
VCCPFLRRDGHAATQWVVRMQSGIGKCGSGSATYWKRTGYRLDGSICPAPTASCRIYCYYRQKRIAQRYARLVEPAPEKSPAAGQRGARCPFRVADDDLRGSSHISAAARSLMVLSMLGASPRSGAAAQT